jgi:Tol biopolymer transport system component
MEKPDMLQIINANNYRTIALRAMLVLICALIFAACTADTSPLVYGVWDQADAPLKSIRRVNADGSSPESVIESTTGLVIQKLNGRHNYANPLSPDGAFVAVYAQNNESIWELNILPTRSDTKEPLFSYPMGSQPSLSISGFSPDSRYYVFTEQDPESGLFTVQIYDLKSKALLTPKGGALFADFFPGSDDLLTIAVGPTGAIAGVQRITLPSRGEQSVYKPPEGEQIGLLLISPDQKNLLVYDLATRNLDRVSFGGGERTTLYQFSGDIGAAFTPGAGYLALTDLSEGIQRMVVFDPDFREIYRQDGVGSGSLAYSQDGKSLAFMTGSPEMMSLKVLNLDPLAKPGMISDSGVFYTSEFSPDGSRIVFIEYKGPQEKTGELYIANRDGSGKKLMDAGVTSFIFGLNNTLLYFKVDTADPQNPKSTLFRIGLDGSGKRDITQPESGYEVLFQ